jgi:hypothetical protein
MGWGKAREGQTAFDIVEFISSLNNTKMKLSLNLYNADIAKGRQYSTSDNRRPDYISFEWGKIKKNILKSAHV